MLVWIVNCVVWFLECIYLVVYAFYSSLGIYWFCTCTTLGCCLFRISCQHSHQFPILYPGDTKRTETETEMSALSWPWAAQSHLTFTEMFRRASESYPSWNHPLIPHLPGLVRLTGLLGLKYFMCGYFQTLNDWFSASVPWYTTEETGNPPRGAGGVLSKV